VSILVAGLYCHDTLIGNDGEHRALGGSAAYASAVFEALGEPYNVAAKVGADFRYFNEVCKPPKVAGARTTSFIDDYRSGERREHVDAVCEALEPSDLQGRHDAGIACAVSGEVPLRTLQRMRALCGVMLADAQGLLREISPQGEVLLKPLHPDAPAQLDYLKASKAEAALLDVAQLRTRLTVLITDGPRGCTLLTAREELHIPAFPANERDPTGAGDCFLAGFAAGLVRHLPAERAARIGAWFGARAVEHIGVPRFTPEDVRRALEAG
jgi:1D-myo-inositol 3-kinase